MTISVLLAQSTTWKIKLSNTRHGLDLGLVKCIHTYAYIYTYHYIYYYHYYYYYYFINIIIMIIIIYIFLSFFLSSSNCYEGKGLGILTQLE